MTLAPDNIILGFTGPICSGCTFCSKHVANIFRYPIFSLSQYVRNECQKRNLEETTTNLQDIGNELRAKNCNDYLVKLVLSEIERNDPKGPVIIDSIRNLGEVETLRQFRNFYLFAIDTPTDVRRSRKGNIPEFDTLDRRDQMEDFSYGQQVRLCVYHIDIVIDNSVNRPQNSTKEKEFLEKSLKFYVNLILNPRSQKPTSEETIMTIAYAQSARSSCLKRRVGAVVTTNDGDILSAAYNEVPANTPSCKDEHGICYKDKLRIDNLKKFSHCPHCGKKLNIKIECPKCHAVYKSYQIMCSKPGCMTELLPEIVCEGCKKDIIKEYGTKDMSQCSALHAEESAIVKLAKFGGGVSLQGATIYVTTFPCKLCANKIRDVGIKKVVYVEPFPDSESIRVLTEGKDSVKIEPFFGVKSRAYFRLFGLG